MREFLIILILLLNLVIQSSIFPFMEVVHIKPDSLLIIVVSFALLTGNPMGALVGFLGGFLQDIFFGNNIGLYALQYMTVGYIVGLTKGSLYIDKIIVPSLTIIISNIIKQFIMISYNFFTQSGIPIKNVFIQVILPETIYTLIFMPIIFYLIKKLYEKKFMHKKSIFSKKVLISIFSISTTYN